MEINFSENLQKATMLTWGSKNESIVFNPSLLGSWEGD